jgi:glutaredoxin
MKVELLVSDWCATCHEAERIWRQVVERKAIEFAVVDMGQPEGRELATRLRIRSIPALVVDGRLAHIGVQPLNEAMNLVASAPDRTAGQTRHAGLGLAASSRAFVLSAVVYLFLAGAFLPFGGLFGNGNLTFVPTHLFGVGFLLMMVYGLGEHMLPRFTGNPIRSGPWSWAQFGLTHLGLWLQIMGFLLSSNPVIAVGGAGIWFSLALFTFRAWPVLWRYV